ncbi:MAG: hypothetical protein WBM17_02120 [Anaerolineales bacterium]
MPATCLFAGAYLSLAILLILIAVRAADFRTLWKGYLAAWLASLFVVGWIPSVPFAREGLLATLAVELPIAAAYGQWRRHPAVLLLTIVLGMNVITRPLLSIAVAALYHFTQSNLPWILVCELAVWFVEAAILAIALRKKARTREALLLSLVLNGASFGIGWLLPF